MTLSDLENAVSKLSPDELVRFRAWFVGYDPGAWDKQIEEDMKSGTLDALADKAIQAHRAGKTTQL